MNKRQFWLVPLLAVLLSVINWLLSGQADIVERFYSSSINRLTIMGLSRLTGIVPFSIGEWLVLFHVPLVIGAIVLIIKRLINWKHLLLYISVVYSLFILLWGMNYNRLSVGDMLNLSVMPTSYDVLQEVALVLVEEANIIREKVSEDENGVFSIPNGHRWVLSEAHVAMENRSEELPILGGEFGRPKAIFLSKPMLYTGITGVYFPFTGEANVNVAIMDLLLPATVLHEMAHQRGIAAEDEANFIAYYTALVHPDPSFQYSGIMLALIHVQNALFRVSPERSREVAMHYSEGIKRDLSAQREFWKPYQGKTNEVSTRVNDAYLKSNRQRDGVASYGRMVDWVIAYQLKEERR